MWTVSRPTHAQWIEEGHINPLVQPGMSPHAFLVGTKRRAHPTASARRVGRAPSCPPQRDTDLLPYVLEGYQKNDWSSYSVWEAGFPAYPASGRLESLSHIHTRKFAQQSRIEMSCLLLGSQQQEFITELSAPRADFNQQLATKHTEECFHNNLCALLRDLRVLRG